MNWLKRPRAMALSLALFTQIVFLYGVSRRDVIPPHPPLAGFPTTIGGWSMLEEGVVEKPVQDVLKADDLLSRTYRRMERPAVANLFVAYFRSQRTGALPHSPKNCLPGAGWLPTASGVLSIPLPGRAEPIRVNRYVVAKGEARSVVLYWYQSRHHVIASEYKAKLYLIAGAIRYNRTDTALVRVTVPVTGDDEAAAIRSGVAFVQAIFAPLSPFVSV